MESPKLLRIVRILFRKSLSATLLGLQHAMRAKKIMGYVAQTKLKRSKNTCSIIAMYVWQYATFAGGGADVMRCWGNYMADKSKIS